MSAFLMDNFNLQPRGQLSPGSGEASDLGEAPPSATHSPTHGASLQRRHAHPPREAVNRLIMNYLITGKLER
eukprot:snap_masked-scaffold370_size193435-processed-gene-0.5 protein:Tk07796 transcript:snap_masked-scaffold370_size193435-processed-gene-0.5-mRNA-1 annotation:"---NA---"